MSEPWINVSPSKDEPKLTEVIVEELCKLQIEEEFVWVDISEEKVAEDTSKSINTSDFETVDAFQLYSENTENAIVAQQFPDNENDDVNNISDEDFVDPESWERFKYKKNSCAKVKYPTPQWLKRLEHGTINSNRATGKKTSDENRNSLLPDMKFYPSTIAVLEKLITDRYLGKYNELVGTGTNSFVFHADYNRNLCMTMPCHNAVKVYKISNDAERTKSIFKRVQREFEHLKIVKKHIKVNGVFKANSPWPIRARENVIVMSFVGFPRTVSPSIQDLPASADNHMYSEIIEFLDRCYNIMHLVHGKLSAKKILCQFDNPCFIGWSHSVKINHPMAMSKLMRDCRFVTEFYKKRGVKVKSTEELFKGITGSSKISNKLMEIINKPDLYNKYDSNPNRKIMDVNGKCRF